MTMQRFVVFAVAGTLILPAAHAAANHGSVDAVPQPAPEMHHVEVSSGAYLDVVMVPAPIVQGPNYRLEVEPASVWLAGGSID